MSRIYYLCFYDTLENREEGRHYELSAGNIVSYVLSTIEKNGHTVDVISASTTQNNHFYKGKVIPVGEKSKLHLFTTFPYKPRVLRLLGRYVTKLQVFFYLLTHLKKDDTLIVYHSLALMNRVQMLRKLCKFRLFLQVEEIYGDVTENREVSAKELEYFKIADAYLFAAKLLNEKINTEGKPYAVIYGTYQAEEKRQSIFEGSEKIHCVYAGTLEPQKGGALMAASAAKHLPENYHVHILGFGTPQEVENIEKLTKELDRECGCSISFHGCLQGEQYIRFLQSCQIGLSTQNPVGAYNDTSFPSKILSYMANGLQVVTVRIPVVEQSDISQHMHYYQKPEPERIAAAIVSAADAAGAGSGRDIIARLDREFIEEIGTLLEEV